MVRQAAAIFVKHDETAIQLASSQTSAAEISAPATELAKGVVQAMKIAKLKLASALAAFFLVSLGLGAIAMFYRSNAAEPDGERYRALFKNGATVEVVAVSKVPAGPSTWWKPDGSPLRKAPVDPIKSSFSGPEAEAARVILPRVSGLKPNDTFRWLASRYVTYSGGQPSINGQPAAGLEYYESTFLRRASDVADTDSDDDGLSDFQETHKYFTDPAKFSTAGDGVSDGDWQRRREFTYTIRSRVKVMPPVNLECISDDYQDAKVLSHSDHVVELEVIHYPLNSNAEAIRANPAWRRDAARLKEYLAPGITTNWDAEMQRDLLAALRADGIEAERLDDKDLVARATAWLLAKSKYVNMFCTHYIHYSDGRAAIYPGLEAKFESDKGDRTWSVQDQLSRELFGKSMFQKRTHGSCTSSAVFLTTALRAPGHPDAHGPGHTPR